jgi:hypothetical protein
MNILFKRSHPVPQNERPKRPDNLEGSELEDSLVRFLMGMIYVLLGVLAILVVIDAMQST